jgi:hypothetical protein
MKHQQHNISQAEKALRDLSAFPAPDPVRESSARRRLLAQASRLRSSARPARRRVGVVLLRLAAAACLGFLALGTLAGTASATNRAAPGDFLYPLDLSMERLALAVAPRPQDKVNLLLSFAAERLAEFEQVNTANSNGQADAALAAYEGLITQVTLVIDSADVTDQPALVEMSEEALSEQEQHLLDVRQDAPEQALPGLDRAIDATQHGQDKVKHHERPKKTPGPPDTKPEHPEHPAHPTHPVVPGG